MRIVDVFRFRNDGLLKLLGIFLTLSSVAGFFHFGVLYYIILALFGLMVVYGLMKKGVKTSPYIIVFLVICALSLIVNETLPVFNAWGRLAVYVLVLFVVSPMLSNSSVGKMRTKLLMYVMDACIILSILSFFVISLASIYLFVTIPCWKSV